METSERSLHNISEGVLNSLNGISQLEMQMAGSSSEIPKLIER